MTIKTLKMVRFGPYINETVVDLEQFTGKVFLVSGDTGAGKTTIFDAICYALYGEPSGSMRKNDALRNQDSAKGDKSYVELLFTGVDGKEYLVHRDTKAIREVGGKPAAMTKDSVNLTDLALKTVVKGSRDVNSRIVELTGFDRDSFVRVSILPQGEFDKFLSENSSERRETLRGIFGTQLYESYADVVQSWLKTAGKQVDRASDACNSLLNRTFGTTDEKYPLSECGKYAEQISRLAESCDKLRLEAEEEFSSTNEKLRQNSTMKSAAESVNANIAAWEATKAEMHRLESLQDQFAARKEQLRRYELAASAAPALDSRNRLARALAETRSSLSAAVIEEKNSSEALAAARTQQEQIKQLAPERESLTADISKLDDLLRKSAEADEAENKMRATENEIASMQLEMTRNQSEQEICLKAQERSKEALEAAKQTASRTEAEEASMNAHAELKDRLSRLSESLVTLGALKKSSEAARSDLAEKSTAADDAALEFAGLQAKYYAGEAARLAQKLEKGVKCPVCGSTEHPFPAAWTDEIPSQQQLDEAEAASGRALATKSAAERKLAEKDGSLSAHCANAASEYSVLMGEELPETGGDKAVEARAAEVGKLYAEASARLEECRKAQKSLKTLEKQLSTQQQKQTLLSEEQERLNNAISALQSRHAAEEATVNEKRSGLGGRDPEKLRAEKAEKLRRSAEIDGLVNSAADGLTTAEKNAASSAMLKKKLESDLERTQQELSAAQEALSGEIARCGFSGEEELGEYCLRTSEIQPLRKEISEYDKSVSAARARLEECEKRLPEDRTPRSTEQFDEAEMKLSAELEERKKRLMELGTKLQSYAAASAELQNIISSSAESIQTYTVLEKLERLICGKSEERIAFETFIQMRMFKGVLQRANERLRIMSGGRYEFELRTQNVRGNASEGLDINMIDNDSSHTKRRDVSTLSGGERFMASFALAIGLSDYTLQRGGNRQSDMLFVDEGFSSLDSSTFEMALNVIRSISAGRRMIGLVTHIDGIKQYFKESQIYVHKGRNGEGSSVEIRCGSIPKKK